MAEKALRYLLRAGDGVGSVELARELLSTTTPDEESARRILSTAFAGDPRLVYSDGAWSAAAAADEDRSDPLRTLLLLHGGRTVRGEPYRIEQILAVRMDGDTVLAACGGELTRDREDDRLRESVQEAMEGAVLIVHDPPGALDALEKWLDAPLEATISLRRLGRKRRALPAGHDIRELAAGLDIAWRQTGDLLDQAELLDSCLEALREENESLEDLLRESNPAPDPLDWSRFAFDREFLRSLPATPGTYRFLDRSGGLLYVGKSNNLQRRIGSYFREGARGRPRIRNLLEELHRIEYEPSGSDLEAVLREAAEIRKRKPARNVQRRVHPRGGVSQRLQSILILEPAEPPMVLRAYLIREGRLLDKIGIGPRGGGLNKIERILEDRFFSVTDGPTPVYDGPDLDVEMVVRWLTTHRDRVVAFDPTNLKTAEEVTERLRWFLAQGSPFDPDGSPITSR